MSRLAASQHRLVRRYEGARKGAGRQVKKREKSLEETTEHKLELLQAQVEALHFVCGLLLSCVHSGDRDFVRTLLDSISETGATGPFVEKFESSLSELLAHSLNRGSIHKDALAIIRDRN